jgi:hypothetical protein
MGAWDSGSFENDAAGDFVGKVVDGGGVRAVRAALKSFDPADEESGMRAVAAAEIIAAANGTPIKGLNDEVTEWLGARKRNLTTTDAAVALEIIKRVSSNDSALASVWSKTGDDSQWHAGLADLVKRLESVIAGTVVAQPKVRRQRAPKVSVGTVFSVTTAKGFVLGIVTHMNGPDKPFAFFQKGFSNQTLTVDDVAGLEWRWASYASVTGLVRAGMATVIGTTEVPEQLQPRPMLRHPGLTPRGMLYIDLLGLHPDDPGERLEVPFTRATQEYWSNGWPSLLTVIDCLETDYHPRDEWAGWESKILD